MSVKADLNEECKAKSNKASVSKSSAHNPGTAGSFADILHGSENRRS